MQDNFDYSQNNNQNFNPVHPSDNTEPPRNSVIAIAIMIMGLAIILVAGAWLWQSQKSPGTSGNSAATETNADEPEQQEVSYPPEASPTDLDLTKNDKIRVSQMQYVGINMIGVRTELGRWPRNADEAKLLIEQDEDGELIDPQTQKPYNMVDRPPRIGEMQYIYRSVCNSSYRESEHVGRDNAWALLLRLDDGSYVCQSTY